MSFPERFKLARKRNAWTQEQAAEKLSCNRSTIANYELGRRKPTFTDLQRIANIMNVPVDFFVDGNQNKLSDIERLKLQAETVFNNANITESDKKEIFDDIMKIYVLNSSKK